MTKPNTELVNLLKSTCMTHESLDAAHAQISEQLEPLLVGAQDSDRYSGINEKNFGDMMRIIDHLVEVLETFGGEFETAVILQAVASFDSIVAASLLDPKQLGLMVESLRGTQVGVAFLAQTRIMTNAVKDITEVIQNMEDPNYKPPTTKPN